MTWRNEPVPASSDAYMAARKKADDTVLMLERVLADMGITVGDRDAWPDLLGRASMSGEPYVYLGTVPAATARRLVDALVYAHSERRVRGRGA
ncbi:MULTISPECIES: hypothetical protein [Streptomyces]|uniref:hypothetical protein n=1 Tax=Streptomyces TaxID=1883 RepID=UPI00163C08AE|nr:MULTISPECIES: hypothetical protein [Streptomyces]MBC2879185.1 hypothetical protein [Streptomyces sp. TYQ1024]UBI38537.1 hypothetical protein K7I03_20105 [Streptomyces mobaraensis]UKW31121.1 hypothetical protein MCU78_20060 [Streptomyces sp. TYQ1024]